MVDNVYLLPENDQLPELLDYPITAEFIASAPVNEGPATEEQVKGLVGPVKSNTEAPETTAIPIDKFINEIITVSDKVNGMRAQFVERYSSIEKNRLLSTIIQKLGFYPVRSSAERIRRQVINTEAKIGGDLLKKDDNLIERHFFYYGYASYDGSDNKNHSWQWHEIVRTDEGQEKRIITRFEVLPQGIWVYQHSEDEGEIKWELPIEQIQNFHATVQWYHYVVSQRVYGTN